MSDRILSRNESAARLGRKPLFRDVKPVMKLAVLVSLAVGLQTTASAQTLETWNGQGNDGLWSNGNNWTPTIAGGPSGNYNIVIPVTGNPQPMLDVSATINNLEIDERQSLTIINASTLTVTGSTIFNEGTLAVASNGSGGTLLITNTATLSGSIGTVQMGSTNAILSGTGTLINEQLISGFGVIVVAALENQGQIQGISPTNPLYIGGSSETVTNSGLISTLDSGTVKIGFGGTVQNAGGTISGGSGSVTLNGCTIIGGTLQNLVYQGTIASTLDGVTIGVGGLYEITSTAGTNYQTLLAGTITNNGSIMVTAPQGALKADLTINSTVFLLGTGSVTVNGQNAYLDGSGTLTTAQTINGRGGNITVNQVADPGGTVTSLSGLTIQVTGGFNNAGGAIGTGEAATLNINGTPVFGGAIVAATDSEINLNGGAVVSGGATFSGGGTSFGVDAALNGVTIGNGSTIEVDNNNVTTLQGTNTNNGVIYLNGSCFSCPPAKVLIVEGMTFDGNGNVHMSNSPVNVIVGGGQNDPSRSSPDVSDSLTNNGNTIDGAGTIGPLNLTNGPKGSIIADQGYPLIISPGAGNTFRNSGTLSAGTPLEPASTLEITGGKFANFNLQTQTLKGGTYNVSGTLQFDNAAIATNAANITLSGGGGQIVNRNGVNALVGFNNNASTGKFTLAGGQNFTTGGLFANAGSLTIGKSSTFTVGGTSTNYSQTGGTTTVDGTLTVPAGGLAGITGGTLQGAGSVNGNVSVGNASGSAAIFIIGDSTKKSAAVSLANGYTQLATGIMDVQIGGTNAGTQYSQLNVTGRISLQGTLNLKLINKFKPTVGETFTILTSPSGIAGTFSTVNGTSINNNEHFAIAYNPDSVVLTVESGP